MAYKILPFHSSITVGRQVITAESGHVLAVKCLIIDLSEKRFFTMNTYNKGKITVGKTRNDKVDK